MFDALAAIALEGSDEEQGETCGRAPTAEESFPEQWAYIVADSKRNLLRCGRQWGKTTGNRLRARRNLALGRRTLYVHMVRENARAQFFHPLAAEALEAGWELDINETALTMQAPNGGLVKAWSADDVRDVAKGRGYQWDDVIVDEPQDFPDDVIEPLMDQVIFPTLFKTGGSANLTGTPPEVAGGYFDRAWESGLWTCFGGPIFDNPHIPEANVREAYAARGIGPGHPIWEREVMGRMVADPSKLAYEYAIGRNDYDPASLKPERGRWRFAMGLDLGFQDCDAIVVVCWDRDDQHRRLYQRYAWADNHQDVDQLAEKVREVVQCYHPSIIIGDHGGHGATKVLETLNNRMRLGIQPKPSDVMVSVGLVNDDLRTGRLLLEDERLKRDMGKVQRTVNPKTKRVEINKKGFHSDLTEALRYAHHGARHFAGKAPPPPETTDQRRSRQLRERAKRTSHPW